MLTLQCLGHQAHHADQTALLDNDHRELAIIKRGVRYDLFKAANGIGQRDQNRGGLATVFLTIILDVHFNRLDSWQQFSPFRQICQIAKQRLHL